MFIFGWGKKTYKDLGPTFQVKCPNCTNLDFFHLKCEKTWFTLAFILWIPVFPYNFKHYLHCKRCLYGFELQGNEIDNVRREDFHNNLITSHQLYRLPLD